MPSAADLVPLLHPIALCAFVGVTAGALLAAVGARMRLRRPRLAWHAPGRWARLPVGPTLFLGLVVAGGAHAWWTGSAVPISVMVGYPAGGLFWFAAVWVGRTVVVTEYGIVPAVRRTGDAVVWSQIVDYAITQREGTPQFVFFYRGAEGGRHRLDVKVPRARVAALREVVRQKLDARFSVRGEGTVDEGTYDRLDDRMDRL